MSWDDVSHLCSAEHICRKVKGQSYYQVTSCKPHTCSSISIIHTPKSRKSQMTTKMMSAYTREYINLDPFHKTKHMGNFVEKELQIIPNTLPYYTMDRVKKLATKEHFGLPEWQYTTLVSRLEHIKQNDPKSLILLKVVSDILPDDHQMKNTDELSQVSGLTSAEGASTSPTSPTFCLRFGAIAVTPGTAIRRHEYNRWHQNQAKKTNASVDACHLYCDERGCMTDIIQPLGTNEYVLDTFSVDSLNECRDTWNLSLSCDKEALERTYTHSFCGDRMKGQDKVNDSQLPIGNHQIES